MKFHITVPSDLLVRTVKPKVQMKIFIVAPCIFVVYLSNTPTNAHTYIVINNLKFTLKHLKRSFMFRSYDHPQGTYFVPC